MRNRPRPSRDHRQSRIVLKGEADYAIWHRGSEQPLNSFPVRADVYRPVQRKQGFFHCRVNHRRLLAVTFGIPFPSLHVVSPALARAPFVASLLDSVRLPKRSTIRKKATEVISRSSGTARRWKMQTKLLLNGTIQHPDLAEALRGENGTFFCQQGGQGYIVTAAEGFSIKSLRPVGRKIVEANVLMTAGPEPWAITKISEDVLEFSYTTIPSPTASRLKAEIVPRVVTARGRLAAPIKFDPRPIRRTYKRRESPTRNPGS